jgi:phosphopantothenate synthetase
MIAKLLNPFSRPAHKADISTAHKARRGVQPSPI